MLVFVYGTLKEECCNQHVIRKLKVEGSPVLTVNTIKKYPMYKSEYYFPYLENQPDVGEHITGELWEIDDSREYELDCFEGVPFLYKKGKIDVVFKDSVIYNDVNCYFKSKETDVSSKNLINEWIE